MKSRFSFAERALLKPTEVWVKDALDCLADSSIQAAIGSQKAQRLHALARNAGVLLCANGVQKMIPSRNGLIMVPVEKGAPSDLETELTIAGRKAYLPLGKLAEVSHCGHVRFEGSPWDFLVLNLGSTIVGAERSAALIHELVHADQMRRQPDQPFDSSAAAKVQREAEAYDTQYRVLDTDWGGALKRVVDLNRDNADPAILYYAPAEDCAWMNDARSVARSAVITAVCHNAHGYQPDGVTPPSAGLISEYGRLGLISSVE